MYEKQRASSHIESLLDGHMMHRFRNSTAEQFANHAADLVRLWQVIHPKDAKAVATELLRNADQIARHELTDWYPDRHHERAAEAIREAARILVSAECPWHKLIPLFEKHARLRSLATALWGENRELSKVWEADLKVVAKAVWGDPEVNRGTIQTTVTRLTQWFEDHGINLVLSVDADHAPPCIRCEFLGVDGAKQTKALDDQE